MIEHQEEISDMVHPALSVYKQPSQMSIASVFGTIRQLLKPSGITKPNQNASAKDFKVPNEARESKPGNQREANSGPFGAHKTVRKKVKAVCCVPCLHGIKTPDGWVPNRQRNPGG